MLRRWYCLKCHKNILIWKWINWDAINNLWALSRAPTCVRLIDTSSCAENRNVHAQLNHYLFLCGPQQFNWWLDSNCYRAFHRKTKGMLIVGMASFKSLLIYWLNLDLNLVVDDRMDHDGSKKPRRRGPVAFTSTGLPQLFHVTHVAGYGKLRWANHCFWWATVGKSNMLNRSETFYYSPEWTLLNLLLYLIIVSSPDESEWDNKFPLARRFFSVYSDTRSTLSLIATRNQGGKGANKNLMTTIPDRPKSIV